MEERTHRHAHLTHLYFTHPFSQNNKRVNQSPSTNPMRVRPSMSLEWMNALTSIHNQHSTVNSNKQVIVKYLLVLSITISHGQSAHTRTIGDCIPMSLSGTFLSLFILSSGSLCITTCGFCIRQRETDRIGKKRELLVAHLFVADVLSICNIIASHRITLVFLILLYSWVCIKFLYLYSHK